MTNQALFSTFDPFHHDTPSVCGVCGLIAPIFRYEFRDSGEERKSEYIKGFCCASCARTLLEVLENMERKEWTKEWAEEQAALEDNTVRSEF